VNEQGERALELLAAARMGGEGAARAKRELDRFVEMMIAESPTLTAELVLRALERRLLHEEARAIKAPASVPPKA
jgi:hypothetical protein